MTTSEWELFINGSDMEEDLVTAGALPGRGHKGALSEMLMTQHYKTG